MNKRIIGLIEVIALLVVLVLPVSATSISELQQQKQQTQKQLDAANANLSGLQSEQAAVNAEIKDLDAELVEVMTAVQMLEEEIIEKEKQIVIAKEEYEAAKAQEEEQYGAMKVRIRFVYETGDKNYLEVFLTAKSYSDMLSKADYIEKLYEYDRELLEEYQAVCERVAELKANLEQEQEELVENKLQLEEEQQYLDELLAEKKAQASDYASQIATVKKQADAYRAQIKKQNAQIRKLEEEERKKAEAAAAAAAAAANGGSSSSGGSSSASASEVISKAPGSATGKNIANYACQFVGNPYVAGGTSLTNGADCSGFTWAVYQAFGISIPRTSTSQRNAGVGVSYENAQPGDIICYAGHVALYLGGGRIVHASTPSTGIKYGTATYREILGVRRIVK